MLTKEQEACNFVTMRHIERVRNLINVIVVELLKRGELHDQSKLESPEVEGFTELTSRLAACTYGSEEYLQCKRELSKVLEHHYANNRHHPEHFKNGVQDMNLVDLLEMFVDWKAASERHNDGNLRKSIEINADRFKMSKDLVQIFENTVDLVE